MKKEIPVRIGFIAVFLSVLMCSMAFSLAIPQAGTLPVIDGVASVGEWDGSVWIDANTTFGGSGGLKRDCNDVPYAQWAAKWSPTTNLLYVVVKVIDIKQVFQDGWKGVAPAQQDYVAICVDANDSLSTVNEAGKNTHMQAWLFGLNTAGTGGIWTNRSNGGVKAPSAGDIPAVAATVNGLLLTYEIALKPFWYYDDVNNVKYVKTLTANSPVGLDVVVGSKTANTFAMISDNNSPTKLGKASSLTQHTLIAATMTCDNYNPMDFNKDCFVNFADLALFGAQWMADTTTLVQPKYVSDPVFTGPWSIGTLFSWPRWWTSQVGSTVSAGFTTNAFLGNGIRYTTPCYIHGGRGAISIDGVYVGDVNTQNNVGGTQISYEYTGLSSGDHAISLQVLVPTDLNRDTVHFLRFEPLNPGVRTTSGTWNGYTNSLTGDAYMATGDTTTPGEVTFSFTGTGITWYGQSYYNSGYANVWIDSVSIDPNVATARNVDLYQAGRPDGALWSWTKTGLTPGTHTVKIRVSKYGHNPASTGYWINWTRFEPIE